MRNIIVACDSYKGCMTSREVNEAIVGALRHAGIANSDCRIRQLEMSDGGEGMLDAFLAAMSGERVGVVVHDALMRPVEACYGIAGDTAVIEVAQAVGLAMIEPEQRNPMRATSWGVGEMIMDAYMRGVRRFIVGLGGSATSDCGIGMLRAMGDKWTALRADCCFTIASDVDSPLLGPNGAARVFAPQKGADASMVENLECRAAKFAEISCRHFGYDRSMTPGAGAAGGLGYAFLQYFDATQQPGAELLLQLLNFDSLLDDATLVITGEGHSDRQTLLGKLPFVVMKHARRHGIVVWLVSGGISSSEELLAAGFSRIIAITPKDVPLCKAMVKSVAMENINKKMSSIHGCV